jgi:hypothetical protein
MIQRLFFVLLFLAAGCQPKDPYDVSKYYSLSEQERVLAAIVTYILDAPPLTKMQDRFNEKHHGYYAAAAATFQIDKYFISKEGLHYFYVIRPTPNPAEKRGVGGHFRMNGDFRVSDFREEFVTPILPEAEVKGRCGFLFDEMVKGTLSQYLEMPSYVQWPNAITYYDSSTYEWKLKPRYETDK